MPALRMGMGAANRWISKTLPRLLLDKLDDAAQEKFAEEII